ncbi:sterol desaturase family protein [Pontiellaceae bacterium B12219]|nr:sterol desaturase family protein [Pontiellaceae bacterium B12219]
MNSWLAYWKQFLLNDGRSITYALLAIAVVSVLECWIPAEKHQGLGGRFRNLCYMALFKVLGIGGLALWFTFVPIAFLPVEERGGWMRVLMVFLNLFVIDLIYYAYHRAQHRFYPLWALHELHHSDAELNATSSYRTYWLELPVQGVIILMPTLYLFGGFGVVHGTVVMAFSLFFLIFAHSNLRLGLGPFQKWAISPQIHRIHHSRLQQHRDCNFAQYFPVIDRIFGTYYAPQPAEYPPTGTHQLESDASILKTFIRPFSIWAAQFKKGA